MRVPSLTCAPLLPPPPPPRARAAGGFAPNKVSVANVLSTGSESRGGRTYYQAEVLTRTADGNEGGRHHVFEATVAGGKARASGARGTRSASLAG